MSSDPTYLRTGDLVVYTSKENRIIWFCNDCRAACIPEDKVHLLEWRRNEDGAIQFRPKTDADSENISPNSEIKILKRLGRKGLVELIETAKTQQTNRKTMKTEKKAKTETETPSRGKLGEILGCSVVSVIRLMGKKGWSFDRVMAACKKAGVDPHPATVKRQLYLGGKGEGEVADVKWTEVEALAPKEPAKAVKEEKAKPAKAERTEKVEKLAKKVGKKVAAARAVKQLDKTLAKPAKKVEVEVEEEPVATDDVQE